MENKKGNKNIFKKISGNIGLSAFTSALIAIFFGLVVGFIVMLFASPENAIEGFKLILVGGARRVGDVFYFATPILMTGLAVGFAFKMGLFNIGASGQYTMGMFFSLYVAFMWELPTGIHWIVAILAGMAGGMLWGLIPGIFKALLNVNEVITSIMFNYIGMFLVDMWIKGSSTMYKSAVTRTNYIPIKSQIPSLGIAGSNVNFGILFAIVVGIIIYVVLEKTTFGYELKASGFNKDASEYAGMRGKRNIILTMVIAGGFAGLGGAFAILSPSGIAGSSVTYEPINIIATTGFDGIAVALLGNSHPIGIIFSAFFISYIQRGGTLASLVGYKPEIIDVVIAVIIYFSAFAAIMNTGVTNFIKKRFKKEDKNINQVDKGNEEDKKVIDVNKKEAE